MLPDSMLRFEYARIAMKKIFDAEGEKFGSPGQGDIGMSDGNKGVQWNIGIDLDSGRTTVGVNLEGMKYSDWPIGKFIKREIRDLSLFALFKQLNREDIFIRFSRDAWQVRSRPPIEENIIGGREYSTKDLARLQWEKMLDEALGCLEPSKNHRGRARQKVTLKHGETRIMEVSPHFRVYTLIPSIILDSERDALQAFSVAKDTLLPIYKKIQIEIFQEDRPGRPAISIL